MEEVRDKRKKFGRQSVQMANDRFGDRASGRPLTALVKVFGCRQAYENRPSTNPRCCGEIYGDFGFLLPALWPLRPQAVCGLWRQSWALLLSGRRREPWYGAVHLVWWLARRPRRRGLAFRFPRLPLDDHNRRPTSEPLARTGANEDRRLAGRPALLAQPVAGNGSLRHAAPSRSIAQQRTKSLLARATIACFFRAFPRHSRR